MPEKLPSLACRTSPLPVKPCPLRPFCRALKKRRCATQNSFKLDRHDAGGPATGVATRHLKVAHRVRRFALGPLWLSRSCTPRTIRRVQVPRFLSYGRRPGRPKYTSKRSPALQKRTAPRLSRCVPIPASGTKAQAQETTAAGQAARYADRPAARPPARRIGADDGAQRRITAIAIAGQPDKSDNNAGGFDRVASCRKPCASTLEACPWARSSPRLASFP